jgi:transcriptional regulator with GAF, ATPase, and Fis domain
LVLDEVGDMPLAAQPKLFRALQEQKIRRIGGREEIEINVRLIAATSRNLPSMIKEGTFRSELYYRLRGVELRVPSLRERADEIVPLAKGFIERFSADYGKQGISLSNDAAEELRRWSFPGNIRELKALVERVVVATGNNRVIHAEQLRELLTTNQEEGIPVAAKTAPLVPAASDCADEDNAQPSTEPVSLASLEQFLDDVRIGTDDPLVRGAKPRLEAALNRILRRLAGAALIRSGYAVSGERQKGMQLLTGDSELKGQGPKRIVNQLLGRRLDEPVTDEDLAKLVAAWKEGKR